MNAQAQPSTTARIECLCGCGQNTSAKANYRPGHDAAHVSTLLQGVLNSFADGKMPSQADLNREASYLPSQALRIKFLAAADKLMDKLAAKKAPKASIPVETLEITYKEAAPVKVGRWEYPGRMKLTNGKVTDWERNTKRDGSGAWVAVEA